MNPLLEEIQNKRNKGTTGKGFGAFLIQIRNNKNGWLDELKQLTFFLDRIYFPDIYIKSINKVIEVKSEYTLSKDIEKNQLKRNAILSKGIAFQYMVFSNNGDFLRYE